jgi:hypothetical protein
MSFERKTTEELIQIAAAARNSGAQITLTGLAVRTTDELLQITAAGKGVVLED